MTSIGIERPSRIRFTEKEKELEWPDGERGEGSGGVGVRARLPLRTIYFPVSFKPVSQLYFMCANNEGSDEKIRMHNLALTIAF